MAGQTISPSLPILFTTGSYYQVGFNMGSFYAEQIKRFFQESSRLHSICVPFMATEHGKDYLEETLKVCQEIFPQFVQELRGMSDGSGIPFEDIFMRNVDREIKSILDDEDGATGCTDIMVNNQETKLMAHNEDTEPVEGQTGYMVNARIVENGVEVEHHTSYCCPGTLPGNTFSYNKHGLVFSLNGLCPHNIVRNAPPRFFLNRAAIRAKNIDEVISILKSKGHGAAYGFCTNIGDVKDPSTIWSIEVGPGVDESLLHVHALEEETDPDKPCHYIHYNKYEHLQIPDVFHQSSVVREERANQMDLPRTRKDVLNILGDTTDELYPLFRSPRPSDTFETTFTSVVDLRENRVDLYRVNPSKEGALPLLRLKIMD